MAEFGWTRLVPWVDQTGNPVAFVQQSKGRCGKQKSGNVINDYK
jgi:hypothetical protein